MADFEHCQYCGFLPTSDGHPAIQGADIASDESWSISADSPIY